MSSSRSLVGQLLWFVPLAGVLCSQSIGAGPLGELDLIVLDAKTNEPLAVRMRIQSVGGRAPRIRNVPRLGNDFTFKDLLTFKLKMGKYQFSIDRGPHYHHRTGTLEVKRNGFDQKTLELPRFVDVHKEGWYAGDLLVTRGNQDLGLLLDAEELDLAVVPSQSTKPQFDREQMARQQRYVDIASGLCDADGARLLATGVPDEAQLESEEISGLQPLVFANRIKESGGTLHVLDPNSWDLPLLLANGMVDSVAVFPDWLRLDGDKTPSNGRVVKDDRFRGPHGEGRFAQEIYFRMLNCGLRIAPSAFSNSGDCRNPPGYNRVYVACGQSFSNVTWWKNLLAGKSIVSNGPVLRTRANGQLPGYIFEGRNGIPVKLTLSCNLGTRQKVDYLELIKNGLVVESVRLDEWAKANGKLPPVEFTDSGWLCVRAYAGGEQNYRAALSAPFYVDFGEPFVDPESVQFFLDWVYERGRMIKKSRLAKAEKSRRLLELKLARDYWLNLLNQAKSTE